MADRNDLRGIQVSDFDGKVSFTTILPDTCRGPWPHIRFEVFRFADAAAFGEKALPVGQLAFAETLVTPHDIGDPRHAVSSPNLASQTLVTDGIFGDSTALQLAAQTVQVKQDTACGLIVGTQVGLTGV